MCCQTRGMNLFSSFLLLRFVTDMLDSYHPRININRNQMFLSTYFHYLVLALGSFPSALSMFKCLWECTPAK